MVKDPKKPKQKQSNPWNNLNQTSKLDNELSKIQDKKEYKPTLKTKQEINNSYYQKNKEKLRLQRLDKYQQNKETEKAKRKARYRKEKQQTELTAKQQSAKYYGAEAYKVLMSFKEYTELSKEKKQLWQDFNWTLQDCQENIKEGLGDVAAIMKLEHIAGKLVRDYWETVKRKKQQKVKSWNVLSSEEQDRLIRYWGYEKARIENGYLEEEENLEREGKEYEKQIELAKFHEERGKLNCSCGYCEESKKIRAEVIAEREKIIKDYEAEQKKSGLVETEYIKAGCYNCGEYKKVDSDSGLCKKCSATSEN